MFNTQLGLNHHIQECCGLTIHTNTRFTPIKQVYYERVTETSFN